MNKLESPEFVLLMGLYAFIGIIWIELEFNTILLLLPLITYLIMEGAIIIKKFTKRRKLNE